MSKVSELISSVELYKKKGDLEGLVSFYRELENDVLPECLLLDKARIIQLTEGGGYALDDVERVLREVIEMAPDYSVAYMELGYFYDAVMDDARHALDVFSQGVSVAESNLRDLCLGQAKALLGLGQCEEALAIVQKYANADERYAFLLEEIKLDGQCSKLFENH